MSKILTKNITVFDYADKTQLFLLGTGSGVSLFSFIAVIGTPGEIVRSSISQVFLVTNGTVKMFLKTMGKKKINTEKFLYWPGVNLILQKNNIQITGRL